VSFATITFCVASQRVFIVAVYFVIDSVLKFLDTLSYLYSQYVFILLGGFQVSVIYVFYPSDSGSHI
jgi:hypothetical protein